MTYATFTAFPSGPFTFRAFAPGTHVILTQTWFAPNTKAGPFDIFGNYLWGTDSSDKMEAPSASDPPSASFYRQIAPLPKRVGATLLHDSSIASISSEITTMDPHSPTHHHPISIDDPMSPTHDGELKAPINDPFPSAFSTAPLSRSVWLLPRSMSPFRRRERNSKRRMIVMETIRLIKGEQKREAKCKRRRQKKLSLGSLFCLKASAYASKITTQQDLLSQERDGFAPSQGAPKFATAKITHASNARRPLAARIRSNDTAKLPINSLLPTNLPEKSGPPTPTTSCDVDTHAFVAVAFNPSPIHLSITVSGKRPHSLYIMVLNVARSLLSR
ncbi:hypothetical protein B0H34DRAFT_801838 [Crassisporium funariophilum]|nr:hypothetical protein B0H34DRAFT_801838 [Crassisporium funariophilum]